MDNKRLVNAIKNSILVFASLHIVILLLLTIITQNPEYINLFSILDLQEFFAGIEKGVLSTALSGLIIVTIFLWFYSRGKN